jgi:tetratricopeptide (TPR) repeat protein
VKTSHAATAADRARRLCAIPILIALSACSAAKPRPPAIVPDTRTPVRLAEADRLVRAGCLDCLVAAFAEYDLLRAIPAARVAATAGAIRAAGLVALREREIGHLDHGYLRRARELLTATPDASDSFAGLLVVIDAMPYTGSGASRAPTSDLDLDRMRRLRINADGWRARLLELAPTDELAAYTYLSFICGNTPPQSQTRDDIVAPVGALRDTTLIAFKRAICRTVDSPAIRKVLTEEPRFLEVKYFEALVDVGEAPRLGLASKLDDADKLFDEMYAWRKEWPALTHSIANIAMTSEEYARAITFYDHTLELEPNAVDAMLGKIRALTFTGRHLEAIATADRLLTQNWFVGDTRYWRALNLAELERYDEAWTDIEAAAKLVVNGDVPKLAGLIAYRRRQFELSRDRFQLSIARNKDDCETHFYLGMVLAELASWERTAEILANAAKCLQANEERFLLEIESIRASSDPPARKEAKIKRREQYIAKGRREIATSFYNVAVASYNLQRAAEARSYAERVLDDEQFGARAKEILSRVKPLR